MTRRWRVCLHALDRTGPPVLARSYLRWLRQHHPQDEVEVIAFRGGDLLGDLANLGSVQVLTERNEAWDPWAPDAARAKEFRDRLSRLQRPDATFLVSISAAVTLPFLTDDAPVVTWVVEQREPFPPGVVERTAMWLGGSVGSVDDLAGRLPSGTSVRLTPEFVESASHLSERARADLRNTMGARDGDLLVVGAGIATRRKAPDLFLEVALHHLRRDRTPAHFVWIGGETDDLREPVRAEAERLGMSERFRMIDSVHDVESWLAAADVLLHPARLDAFPLVCLHAAAAGVPVVGFSGAGGLEEMFGPTFVGAAYPDVGGLREHVEQLAETEARDLLGAAQRDRVIRYTAPVAAPDVHDALLAAATS